MALLLPLVLYLVILLSWLPLVLPLCPRRCVCQNLSPSMATLCAKKGLLSVPATVDRRTVELRLADNFITRLRRQDLANMSNLVDLTLSRNTLGEVVAGAFADLRALRSLYLDGNRLTRLCNVTLRGLTTLRLLTVSSNQLSHIANETFEDFITTLEDLDLSYNNLETLPWEAVQRMSSLHFLGLDHNLLDRVLPGAFTQLHKLSRLDLTSNRLRTLAPDALFLRAGAAAAAGGPLAFSLAGNPLHCNCEVLWLRRQRRQDQLETCATPAHLAGRSFWAVGEEEFLCEAPVITRHSPHLRVVEGQRAVLRCKAVGDPEPGVHWLAPDGRLVHNSSRSAFYANGTLEVLVATVRDDGTFTCIASNAAGETTTNVRLDVVHLPRVVNGTAGRLRGGGGGAPSLGAGDPPGPSDMAAHNGHAAAAPGINASDGKGRQWKVEATDVKSTSVLVKWAPSRGLRGVRIYQVQYNSTAEGSLTYRMVPAPSTACPISGLTPATDYDLCVVAIYDDGGDALAATRLLGCVTFQTGAGWDGESLRCSSTAADAGPLFPEQLLGSTMIIIIGGIIVACLLVFTVVLVVGYKACAANGNAGGCKSTAAANGRSQTGVTEDVVVGGVGGEARFNRNGEAGFQQAEEQRRPNLGRSSTESSLSNLSRGREQREGPYGAPRQASTKVKPDIEQLLSALAAAEHLRSRAAMATAAQPFLPARRSASVRWASDRDPPHLSPDGWPGPDCGGGGGQRSSTDLGAKRSRSFDAGSFTTLQDCSAQSKRISHIWTKRSMSVNGMLMGLEEADLTSRRAMFSSSDWILESTV
ncbi:unnamed protein product [Lampetra fluviatilis]